MIEEPRITELGATPTAFIHLAIPRAEMPTVMGPAIQEVISTVTRQGVAITGPVFAHHLRMEPGRFDFEVGVPVAAAIAPAGRVRPGSRPATRVARTVYQGPYAGLPEAWGRFHAWVERSGHRWAEDIWECYLTHPDSEPDPMRWRTELNRPLLD